MAANLHSLGASMPDSATFRDESKMDRRAATLRHIKENGFPCNYSVTLAGSARATEERKMGLWERMSEKASLMSRMIATVGAADHIPASFAGERQLRQAATRCMGCGKPDDCAAWLDEHAGGADRAPGYCPNRDLFETWKTAG